MGESLKTALYIILIVCALQALKYALGVGVAFTVALATLSFCIGALWGAGNAIQRQGGPDA